MNLNWFQLVLVFIGANVASKIIQKTALKDAAVDPTAFSAFSLFMVGLMTVPFAVLEKTAISGEPKIWLLVFLSASFYTGSTLFYYHALKSTEISQVETIVTSRSVWMMLLGAVFFHEALNLSKLLGVLLIFAGLAVIYWRQGRHQPLGKAHLYVFLYTLLISGGSALDKFAIGYFSVAFYQVVIFTIPAFLTVIFVPGTLAKILPLLKLGKTSVLIMASCFLQAIACLSLYRAYQVGGELSVIGPLAQISTVLTIIVGIIFLRERWNLRRKLIGIALALLGVFFIKVLSF